METNAAPKSVRWLVIVASVFLIAGLALSGFNAYMAFAAPLQQTYAGPTMVGFEGYLTDAVGTPQDGTFDLTFRLYDVDTGGAALWTEPHSGVTVTDGLYSVQLGETVPLGPGDFSGARWLGIEVNTDGEMTPRIPISAVPWALNASGLTGHPVAATAPQLGEALVWDGSAWAPGAGGSGGGSQPEAYRGGNLVKNWPMYERDDPSASGQPEWWEVFDDPALTEVDTAAEGIPQIHTRASKLVISVDGGGADYAYQSYTHADEWRLDDNATHVSLGIWVRTPDTGTVTVELYDNNGSPPASLGTATTSTTNQWVYLTIEDVTVGTTSTDLRITHSANSATVYFAMPMLNVGPAVRPFEPRRTVRVPAYAVLVDNGDPGGAYVNVDVTDNTDPLAVAIVFTGYYRNFTQNSRSLMARRSGSSTTVGYVTTHYGMGSNLENSMFWVMLDDGQVFQYGSTAAAGDTEQAWIHLLAYERWE